MLIEGNIIKNILFENNININGALHIGAYECEELPFYKYCLNIEENDIIWIEANKDKVEENIKNGKINIYNALITDKDNENTKFNISNNGQSSSILELETHKIEYPKISYISDTIINSITIDSFYKKNNLNPEKYNFWNLDIQGAELLALKGAVNSIKYAKALYLEVNEKELYKNCAFINEIDDFLKAYNFKRVITYITKHGWGDALYIKF